MKPLISILLSLVVAVGSFQPSAASPPEVISYQGILTDDQGVVVEDGEYGLLFEIFDAASAGNMIWDQPITVSVTDGLYNVLLSEAGLATAFENAETYMQVTIQSGPPSITPPIVLDPRQRIASVPYALSASTSGPDPQAPPPVIFAHDSDAIGQANVDNGTTWTEISQGNLSVSVTVPATGVYELCVLATISFKLAVGQGNSDTGFRIVNDQGPTVVAGPVGRVVRDDDRASTVHLHGCESSPSSGTTYTYTVELITDSPDGVNYNYPDNVNGVNEPTMSTLTAWAMQVQAP